jgi:hypothetical protein
MNPSAVFEAYINVAPFVKTIFPVSRVRFIENMFIKKQMLTDDYALIFFYLPSCQGPLTYEVPFPIIPPKFVLDR